MSTLRLLYDMFLPVVFSIPVLLALITFYKTKLKDNLVVAALFIVFILDHLIISLTELIPSFAAIYDNIFVNLPTWKTLIYFLSFACMIYLFEYRIRSNKVWVSVTLLIFLTFFQMFIPMLPTTSLTVWIYYLPPQLFLFTFSLLSVRMFSAAYPDKNIQIPFIDKKVRTISWTALIFSVLIVLEDSFVIFFVDNYSSSLNIYNRNNCEDIFRIIMVFLTSSILIHYLINNEDESYIIPAKKETVIENKESETFTDETITNTTDIINANIYTIIDEHKLNAFADYYMFTQREKKIFVFILTNKSNQEISEELMISLGTVKTHTHNIFSKLDVTRRREAIDLYNNYTE